MNGAQFHNPKVEHLLQENNIQLYSTHNEPKAMIAERFIRTLRGKIESNYILTQSTVWYDVLPQLIYEYNTTYHHSIKMTPEDACKPESFLRAYLSQVKRQKVIKSIFNFSNHVRISVQKKTFEKGTTPNWTEEIYEVREVINYTNPITYKLKDLAGEDLDGSFYNEQLQLTDQEIYRIDRVLKRRRKRSLNRVDIPINSINGSLLHIFIRVVQCLQSD